MAEAIFGGGGGEKEKKQQPESLGYFSLFIDNHWTDIFSDDLYDSDFKVAQIGIF